MKHARADYDRIQDPTGKIPEDEPVFLIRGQDEAAVPTLAAYAEEAERLGASEELIAAVEDQIRSIQQWQFKNGNKVPDL